MRYWKGNTGTEKEGYCGTMDDNGSVPDSVEITKAEYDAWVAAHPTPAAIPTQLETDIANMDFTSLADAKTKMQALLERIRKGER